MATRPPRAAPLVDNVLLRVAGYYALLGGLAALVWNTPPLRRLLLAGDATRALLGIDPPVAELNPFQGGAVLGTGPAPAAAAALAVTGAFLLALPVAWVYQLTRRRKGYRQSVVHTLLTLPVVVAGVVILVKHSLALAFSLAGIVAAVRFRNTLEDSKDAVYIFLATGIGLAAGVHLPVAVVLSALFNVVILMLWATDFASIPPDHEGRIERERMEEARLAASRTGEFVAKVDDEILRLMSPQQLDALAERAWRRRRRYGPELPTTEWRSAERLLRVRTTDPAAARAAIEPLLNEWLKRWRLGGTVHEENGTHVVEYGCALKKSTPAEEVAAELQLRGAPHVIDVSIV